MQLTAEENTFIMARDELAVTSGYQNRFIDHIIDLVIKTGDRSDIYL